MIPRRPIKDAKLDDVHKEIQKNLCKIGILQLESQNGDSEGI